MFQKRWLIVSLLAALLLSACTSLVVPVPVSVQSAPQDPTPPMQMGDMVEMAGMGEMTSFTTDDLAPLVLAYYGDEEIFFIHTEASDPQVAGMLTEMMGPRVVVVPELAEIPADLLGAIYVFTNGVEGMGPMGFQPDVFSAVPGDEAYMPLVEIHHVAWQEGTIPRVLRSVAELQTAEAAGDLVIRPSGIAVNAPVLVWPDDHR